MSTLARQETGLVKSAFAKELAKRELQGGTFILSDVSGSMNEATEVPGERRIDALRGVVYGLKQQQRVFRSVVFSSDVYEADQIPEPSGGTNLAQALDYLREQDCKHAIIISDGQPDNAEFALASAKALVEHGCKRIDIFYVGPKGAYAQGALDFMNQLAKLTGANVGSVRFDQLEESVKLALASDAESLQERSGGAIAL